MVDKELKSPCPLSEGEWVQYLQVYVTTNVTLLLTVLTIILALFVIMISLSTRFVTETLLQHFTYIIFWGVFVVLMVYLLRNYMKESKLTNAFIEEIKELIEEIIDGKIKSDKIRDKWKDINKK